MKVLVLGGGNSPEREVSLRSARAVHDALVKAGYETIFRDPADGLDMLLESLPADTIVFPILHGVGGEDGTIQSALESRKIAFLGADSKTSADCFDKWTTRQHFSESGLSIANGQLVNANSYRKSELSTRPHVLKVNRGGSSIGTLIVRNPAEVDEIQVAELFKLDEKAVLEELIEGIEITVPILDQKSLPVIEIVPPKGLEFDYENKYNGATAEICPPKNVSEQIQQKAQHLAEKAHQAMNCRHLSRVDMIVKPSGEIVLLEINTIPGLTDQSLYPKSAAVSGLSMPKLTENFVQMVVRD